MLIVLYMLIALAVLGLIAGIVSWWHYRHAPKEEPIVNPADMECCGQHEVCEKESLLAAISKQIEYYDDEELDRFKGRSGDDYTEEEAEEFRNVLYTMRSEEVAGWVRSLQLRQVNLPDVVKDEVFLLVGERRSS
ncbi:MAG: phospholipase [Bacteroidaceae bacterium]|nr:phospholipase [Bacteroidaceae bacterium]